MVRLSQAMIRTRLLLCVSVKAEGIMTSEYILIVSEDR